MTRPFDGMHALVTGASRGIGARIASDLEAAGARVSRLSRRGGAGIIPCDITQADAVAQAFTTARAAHGPIRLLINNAGAVASAAFNRSDALLDEMLEVNFKGAWHCTQAALDDLLAAPWARVVNVASIAGQKGFAYVSAYCAAKHALIGLTRSLAAEYAGSGITFNAVCPGYTDTELVHDASERVARHTGRPPAEIRARFAKQNPQGRLFTPAEVSAAVLWLCSSQAAALNGQSLSLSGGEITP